MTDFFTTLSEYIVTTDTALLLAINGLHTPWLDTLMHTVSMRTVWIPFYLVLFIMVWKRYGWRMAVVCLLSVILAVTVADQLCGSILRGFIGRKRPSNLSNPISYLVHIVNDHRGGNFGFPSCHAANTAVVAAMLSFRLKKWKWMVILFGWAMLVSVSRVYLGVHYPGDIFVGFIIGVFISWGIWRLLNISLPRVRIACPFLRLPAIRICD